MTLRVTQFFYPLLLAATVIFVGASSQAADWKAGTARACITPETPMPMAGYASRGAKPAEGTLNDLWAKALVLEDAQGRRAALVTLDLIGLDRELSQAICNDIAREQNWTRDQIALCCSHTHCGPVVHRNLVSMHYFAFEETDRKLVDEYARNLQATIVGIVREAVAGLQPADLSWGSGTALFAVNRRNNKADEVPSLRAEGKLKGPSDHDVPVLLVRREGKPAAVLFGYACHCTTLGIFRWSGDYAGFAQQELETRFPGAQAMFWAGCGADQNPLPRQTVELAQEYGRQLAQAVADVLAHPLAAVSPELTTTYREIDLPLSPLPTRAQLEEETAAKNQYAASRARYLLKQVDAGQPLSPTYPYPVSVWKLGREVTLVFLGGEVVVDYALRLKDELATGGAPRTSIWCAGYANDVMAYIPSRRVLLEGGYEGGGAMIYYGLPTTWAPEVEEQIVETVQALNKKPQ